MWVVCDFFYCVLHIERKRLCKVNKEGNVHNSGFKHIIRTVTLFKILHEQTVLSFFKILAL